MGKKKEKRKKKNKNERNRDRGREEKKKQEGLGNHECVVADRVKSNKDGVSKEGQFRRIDTLLTVVLFLGMI